MMFPDDADAEDILSYISETFQAHWMALVVHGLPVGTMLSFVRALAVDVQSRRDGPWADATGISLCDGAGAAPTVIAPAFSLSAGPTTP